jgi:23S rRNA pseudouridine1911/1915/1917 synthase
MKKSINTEVPFRPGDHILYKNNQLIALNKPAGIPVQPDNTGDKALIDLAEIYTKSKLLLIHRLDRPVTGIVLFAKTKSAQQALSADFKERRIQKTYLAVVRTAPETPEGTLVHYLKQDIKENRSIVFKEAQPDTQQATLHYKTLASSDNYHLLQIDLETGRHHQIRAQLAAIGCSVKGDVKYGARRSNADRSIHLHAWKLRFSHPIDHTTVEIVAPLPQEPLWQAFQHMLPNS